MILLLLLTLAGLATLPLWPEAWRLGLGLGWCAALALELLVFVLRRRAMAQQADARNFQRMLLIQVLAFLGKLVVVFAGGVLGAKTGWYHYPSYLLAFAAGLVLGEAVPMTALFRATRAAAERPAGGGARETPQE
jgi:hypothetical protein